MHITGHDNQHLQVPVVYIGGSLDEVDHHSVTTGRYQTDETDTLQSLSSRHPGCKTTPRDGSVFTGVLQL